MLHRGAPDEGVLELADDGAMELVAKVLQGAPLGLEDDGALVVGQLTFGLGVDPDELEVLPHLLEQGVVVPLVVGGDGHAVGDLADDVELLDRDLVDLVEEVDAGHVAAVALDDVDEVVRGRVVPGEEERGESYEDNKKCTLVMIVTFWASFCAPNMDRFDVAVRRKYNWPQIFVIQHERYDCDWREVCLVISYDRR